jgi:hypothetical protein
VGGTNPTPWPFKRVDTGGGATFGPSRFFDPQAVYHPQSGRLFMIYSEENATGGSTGPMDFLSTNSPASISPFPRT